MAAGDDADLATSTYWDSRYSGTDGENPVHEWILSYTTLLPFLERQMFTAFPIARPEPTSGDLTTTSTPRILHLGSGDSEIPSKLHEAGYTSQSCADFSPVLVSIMKQRHAALGISWHEVDVRCMPEIPSASFEIAFDKSTLDAMMYGSPWDPPAEVRNSIRAYLAEVGRVLAPGGRFLAVSFRQPHFVRPLLEASGEWTVELETLVAGESSFEYFGWCLRRRDG